MEGFARMASRSAVTLARAASLAACDASHTPLPQPLWAARLADDLFPRLMVLGAERNMVKTSAQLLPISELVPASTLSKARGCGSAREMFVYTDSMCNSVDLMCSARSCPCPDIWGDASPEPDSSIMAPCDVTEALVDDVL